jgi:hypothetical protein
MDNNTDILYGLTTAIIGTMLLFLALFIFSYRFNKNAKKIFDDLVKANALKVSFNDFYEFAIFCSRYKDDAFLSVVETGMTTQYINSIIMCVQETLRKRKVDAWQSYSHLYKMAHPQSSTVRDGADAYLCVSNEQVRFCNLIKKLGW